MELKVEKEVEVEVERVMCAREDERGRVDQMWKEGNGRGRGGSLAGEGEGGIMGGRDGEK